MVIPSTRLLRVLLPVALICTVGCPRQDAVWIATGSTPSSLIFVVGERTGVESQVRIYSLRIERCAGTDAAQPEQLWAIVEAEGAVSATPSRVRYGVTPSGFVERVPAKPIGPGCYIARLGGSGTRQFEVTSDSTIRQE